MTGVDPWAESPDGPRMVPPKRGVVVGVVVITVLGAFLAAFLWWSTFPDIDEQPAPPAAGTPGDAGGEE